MAATATRELLCDVFTPPDSAPAFPNLPDGLRVGVLVIHGGGWMTGEKEQLEGYAISLGRKGYVCVTNSYRLASEPAARPEQQENPASMTNQGEAGGHFAAEEGKWPAMIHDCKAAVRWMRANCGELGISPDHIAVTGNSAGGHLSLMVCTPLLSSLVLSLPLRARCRQCVWRALGVEHCGLNRAASSARKSMRCIFRTEDI